MNNYSPNMLKTFEQCQEKFFLKYIQRVSIPQLSELFAKGKKIHALASYYLQGADVSKMEKVLTANEKAVWEALKASKYFKLNVINTEYNLSCKVGKYWIGGRLDAFVKDGENYFILDYKTGNIPQNVQDDLQTIVYLLAADRYLNKKGGYNSLKFVYLGLKQGEEKEILLTPELKKQYEEKIISLCEKIDFAVASNVFNKQKENCKFCEGVNGSKNAKESRFDCEYYKVCKGSC